LRRSALRGLSVIPAHTDNTARLRTFRRPVLIMTGSNTVPFHRRINEILAQTLPLAERIELAGGHTTPVSAADDFVATLQAFLARHRER
jgi:pimeloyl-ACP methyl ester carboxylesterase